MSNQKAMICSAICHVPKVFFTVSASVLPVESPVLAMPRIFFLFFLNKHDGKPLDVAESSEVRRKLPVERYLTDVDVFLDGC